MSELVLKTSLSMDEIEENFKDFDLASSLEQALQDVIAYNNGEPVSGMVIQEYTLSDEDGSVIAVKTTVTP